MARHFNVVLVGIVFFVLLASGFSITATTPADNVRLYRINTVPSASYSNVETNFDHIYSSTVSTSSNVISGGTSGSSLSDGAVICPGVITVQDNILSYWAVRNGFAGNRIPEPPGYTLNQACTYIPTYSSINQNQPVLWSTNAYNTFIDEDLCTASESCYGQEGSLAPQPVEYDSVVWGSQSNRRGDVNFICTGEDSITVRRGTTTVANRQRQTTSGTVFSHGGILLTQEGTYTIDSQFDVEGCLGIIRYPQCANYNHERIYGRTAATGDANAPEYSLALPTLQTTIHVQDIQPALSVNSVTPQAGSTIQLAPGQSQRIVINVRNTGDVTVQATGVSVNAPLQVTPCPFLNGFNQNIIRFGFEDLCVILTNPATGGVPSGQTSLADITFSYRAQGPTCSSFQPDVRNFIVTYNVRGDVTPQQESCFITPASTAMRQNEIRSFPITCVDGNNNPLPSCQNVQWSATGAQSTIASQDNQQATLQMLASSGTTILNATVDGRYSCHSTITARPAPVQPAAFCSITPNPQNVQPNQAQQFDIRCRDQVGTPTQCNNEQWQLTGLRGSVTPNDQANLAFVTVTSTSGSGTLSATVDNAACSAGLFIPGPGQPTVTSCQLIPSAVNARVTDPPTRFDIQCSDATNASIPCLGVTWSINGVMGNFVSRDNTHARVQLTSPSGTGSVNARVGEGNIQCSAAVTMVSQQAVACTLSPSSATVTQNGIQTFGVSCTSQSGATVPCSQVNWALSAGLSGSFLQRSDTGAQVQISSPPGSVGDVVASGNGFSCTASVAVGARGIPFCTVNPSPAIISETQSQVFSLQCFDPAGAPQQCPPNTQWRLSTGLPASITIQSATSATVLAQGPAGTGTLDAITSRQGLTCSAQITLQPLPAQATSCVINPSQAAVPQNSVQFFGLTCRDAANLVVPCPAQLTWSVSGITANFFQRNSLGAQLQPTSAPGSSGTLTARANSFSCTSAITVQAPPAAPSCAINPATATIGQGQTASFALECFGTGGVPQPCFGMTQWKLSQGIPAVIASSTDTSTSVVAQASTGSGTLTATTSQGLICNAQITLGNGRPPPPPPGQDSDDCTFIPSVAEVRTGGSIRLGLRCPNELNEVCNNPVFTVDPSVGSFVSSGDEFIVIDASTTSGQGTVSANIDSDPQADCSVQVTVSDQICQDFI